MIATATALFIMLITVLVRGLFAGYETGFVSLNRIRIRHLAEEEKNPRAARLLRYIERPDRMLTMLLVGTNLVTVVGTVALTRQIGALYATLVATPAFLIFSEIIPKSVFRAHPNRTTLWFLPAIRLFYGLLSPLTTPVYWLTRAFLRLVGERGQYIPAPMSSPEDVRHLVDESAEQGSIEPEEQRMIHSVMGLHSTHAKEIMTPRIDIQALPDTATKQELLATFERTGRTRIPIYHETIDTVVGVVNVHDVLLDAEPQKPDIARFIRDIMHVPDTMAVDDLFDALKKEKQHMAIVTDEYGGTDGLITIEDILEQIFGEIRDEHDREESSIHQVAPDAYVVDARMVLEEVAQVIGLPIEDDLVETVGGLVMRVAGRIPVQGEVIAHHGLRFTILAGETTRILKVRLDVLPEAKQGGALES